MSSNLPLKQYFGQDDYAELVKYKEAVLWLYEVQGHDLCHENIKDLFSKCGLPPKELKLPDREEFRQRCMKHEEEIYRDDNYQYIEDLEKACGKAVFDMNSPEDMERMKGCADGY